MPKTNSQSAVATVAAALPKKRGPKPGSKRGARKQTRTRTRNPKPPASLFADVAVVSKATGVSKKHIIAQITSNYHALVSQALENALSEAQGLTPLGIAHMHLSQRLDVAGSGMDKVREVAGGKRRGRKPGAKNKAKAAKPAKAHFKRSKAAVKPTPKAKPAGPYVEAKPSASNPLSKLAAEHAHAPSITIPPKRKILTSPAAVDRVRPVVDAGGGLDEDAADD